MAAKRSKWTHAAALIAATALMSAGVSGCGLGRAIGISKSSPDEFAVVTKAPLVLPPDYELRPPKPGAKRPQEQDPSEAAKQALFKNQSGEASTVATNEAPTSGEQALLASVGANQAGSNLRDGVARDNKVLVRKSESFSNKLLFGSETVVPASAVTTSAESGPAAAAEETDASADEAAAEASDEAADEGTDESGAEATEEAEGAEASEGEAASEPAEESSGESADGPADEATEGADDEAEDDASDEDSGEEGE